MPERTERNEIEPTTAERVEALEKELSRERQSRKRERLVRNVLTLVMAVAIAGLAYMIFAAEPPHMAEAQVFRLVDAGGATRAALFANEHMTSFTIYGEAPEDSPVDRIRRIMIAAGENGAALDMHDADGTRRISLGTGVHGAIMRLYDEDGTQREQLGP